MSPTYKWLGGIGYILSFIPYVNFVSSILIAVAWILMGKDTREKVFTVLGILMIALFAAGIALVVTIFTSVFMMIPMGGMGPSAEFFERIGPLVGTLIAVGGIILGLVIAVFILDIIAHFRAAKIFDNKWFKLGGWLRIGEIIALVIAIPLIIISIPSSGLGGLPSAPGAPGFPMEILLSILWPLAIFLIVALLATIFSIVAFFTIPEEEETGRQSAFEVEF
ncbi:MAG TPA: hypothetical protein ENG52_04480 [Nitrososphaeria archaeon]|nr:hypothetical protein [Nitrososphaeria archaeon]